MNDSVEIQNVERMRRQAGIDDVELREQVRLLRVGDVVKLTFLAGPGKSETLRVRITAIRRPRFTGELATAASSPQLAALAAGSQVRFTGDHIHSVSADSGRRG